MTWLSENYTYIIVGVGSILAWYILKWILKKTYKLFWKTTKIILKPFGVFRNIKVIVFSELVIIIALMIVLLVILM